MDEHTGMCVKSFGSLSIVVGPYSKTSSGFSFCMMTNCVVIAVNMIFQFYAIGLQLWKPGARSMS